MRTTIIPSTLAFVTFTRGTALLLALTGACVPDEPDPDESTPPEESTGEQALGPDELGAFGEESEIVLDGASDHGSDHEHGLDHEHGSDHEHSLDHEHGSDHEHGLDHEHESDHEHAAADSEIGVLEQAGFSCAPGYMYCPLHGDCVPWSTSKVCHKDANKEYTTTTKSSLVCSYKTSSVTTVGHAFQVTWDSYYQRTQDNSGHTRTIDYKCSNTLQCGMQCGQTKQWYSGWLAHRWNTPNSPHYCLDCGYQH